MENGMSKDDMWPEEMVAAAYAKKANTPDPSQSFEDKLNVIFTGYARYVKNAQGLYSYATEKKMSKKQAKQAITQAVKQLVEGIIGEDEVPTSAYSQPGMYEINERNKGNATRNKLRAEQRVVLLKALGGEK